MAIRKFRKHMKPFIWFITIAFALSTAIVGLMSFKDMHGRLDNYAFKLNGEKVQRIEIERTKSTLNQNFSHYLGQNLDRSMLDSVAFDEVINKKLTLEIADDLHVNVSSGEINSQYKAIEKSLNNKEQFKRMLAAQGYTRKTYKKEIEENLLIQKTFEKIASTIKPTDEELKNYYDRNQYSVYNNKPFEEVENSVKESYIQTRTMDEYFALLGSKKSNMKLENVESSYIKDEPKVVISKDGFDITNVNIIKKAMEFMMKKETKEQAMEDAKKYYIEQIELIKKIQEAGINNVDKNLPLDYQIGKYQQEYFEKVKDSIEPTNEELQKYFKSNSLYKGSDFNTIKDEVKEDYKNEEAQKRIVKFISNN